MNLPLLTNSAAKAARSCLRKYRNRYLLRLVPLAQPETAELGDLAHLGLETWWRAQQIGITDSAAWITTAIQVVRDRAEKRKIDAFQVARAEALLIGYHARWADDAERYEVLAVEVEFRTALVNPDTDAESKTFAIAGKLDVVVRERATGRVLLIEHKTSSEDIAPGSFYWLRLHMDSQISIYFDGGKSLGFDVQGCLYDVLGKPDLRPLAVPLTDEEGVKIVHDASGQRVRTKDGKKWRQTGDAELGYAVQTRPETPDEFRARLVEKLGEEPERYFVRGEVSRDGADLADAARDRWQLATQLRDAARLERFPRNPDACMAFGRACEFLEACVGRADLQDPFLFKKLADPHPELAGPASIPSREETAA